MISPETILSKLTTRVPLDVDLGRMSRRTIMVTGAGGSIGSEICRLLYPYAKKLVVVGRSELGLFELEKELPGVDLALVDMTDPVRLACVIAEYRPDEVFHVAAHKHVPICENNAGEAIKNNVFGTLNAIVACEAGGVEHLVVVSTDKAIDPTSVMGATKRAAEMVVTFRSGLLMPASCVRFGNVLGSSGSVFGIFAKQIEAGLPVTITTSEMDRFFMSAREAATLSVLASDIRLSGRIATLDLGAPIKIVDLAKAMMDEAGKQVPINFTGIRPGEKIHEELHVDGTERFGDLLVYPQEFFARDRISSMLNDLRLVCNAGNHTVKEALKKYVMEYRP